MYVCVYDKYVRCMISQYILQSYYIKFFKSKRKRFLDCYSFKVVYFFHNIIILNTVQNQDVKSSLGNDVQHLKLYNIYNNIRL